MLNKAKLISDLVQIFTNVDPSKTPLQAAQQIADAIEEFVKSGTVVSNGQTSPTVPGAPATITNLQGSIQ